MVVTRLASRSARAAAAAAHLDGLLDLARVVHCGPALGEVLCAVARTVSRTLGFGTVVVNLYRPRTDHYEAVEVYGNEQARVMLLGDLSPAASWSAMLDSRFERRGVFFIPEGAVSWDGVKSYTPKLAPDLEAGDAAWRCQDALLVSLDGPSGRHYGIVSVDEPASGLRPDDEQLEVLRAVAAHAALAIESAERLAELQAVIARQRAVIGSSLDCVIAIDQSGRVLEFNPAAERTFGFSTQDALGRELAELIVPPEAREKHRRGLRRVVERGGGELLGRRIEMVACRRDASRLPVELTLTLVPGGVSDGLSSDRDEPVIYGFVRDISDRRRAEQQLAHLASHDPLTGLPNRVLVERELDLALARAHRVQASVALMFVDLDDFKAVNDQLGHAAGDRLLTAVADRLRAGLRDCDLLGRHGGDEFIVVLADLDQNPVAAAQAVAIKLLDGLRDPFVIDDTELQVAASVGISVYPRDADSSEALMRCADLAMYRAKTAGGDQSAFHRSSDTSAPAPPPALSGESGRRAEAMTHRAELRT